MEFGEEVIIGGGLSRSSHQEPAAQHQFGFTLDRPLQYDTADPALFATWEEDLAYFTFFPDSDFLLTNWPEIIVADNDPYAPLSPDQTPASTPSLTNGASTPQSQGSPRAIGININPHPRPARTGPTPKSYRCRYSPCGKVASSSKDLHRHELQVHQKPGAGEQRLGWYACCCAYPTSRKDDLKRHLRTCKKYPVENYVCRCLQPFTEEEIFYNHISTCGAKSRGRPKLPSRAPAAEDAQWSS